MTTFGQVDETCAVCGESSKQLDVLSSWSGSALCGITDRSLDARSVDFTTLQLMVQMCPHCGYCADHIRATAPSVAAGVIAAHQYKQIVSRQDLLPLAAAFLGQAAISHATGELVPAARQTLHAAWASDDEGSESDARELRLQAIGRFLEAREAGQRFGDMVGEELLLIDLERRCGLFHEASLRLDNLTENCEAAQAAAIVRFQRELIRNTDSARHSIAEAESFKQTQEPESQPIPDEARRLIADHAGDADINWWGIRYRLVQLLTEANVEDFANSLPPFRRYETQLWVMMLGADDPIAFSDEERRFNNGMRVLRGFFRPEFSPRIEDFLQVEYDRLVHDIDMRREVLESPGAYRLGVRTHIAKNVVAAEHLQTLLELLQPGREFSRQEADAIIPEPVDEWVAKLGGGSTDVRRDAATVLGEMAEYAVDSTDALLALLRDDAPAVRKAALAALDKIGWQHAPTTGRIERLIPFLIEGDWIPVKQAIRGLESLGKEAAKALPHLRKLRDTSTNRYVIDDVNKYLEKVDGVG